MFLSLCVSSSTTSSFHSVGFESYFNDTSKGFMNFTPYFLYQASLYAKIWFFQQKSFPMISLCLTSHIYSRFFYCFQIKLHFSALKTSVCLFLILILAANNNAIKSGMCGFSNANEKWRGVFVVQQKVHMSRQSTEQYSSGYE